MRGFVCGPRVYEYGGWVFEFGYCGPWPLKKDGELRARMGRKFLSDIGAFFGMTREEKAEYRVGGGCQQF